MHHDSLPVTKPRPKPRLAVDAGALRVLTPQGKFVVTRKGKRVTTDYELSVRDIPTAEIERALTTLAGELARRAERPEPNPFR